MFFSQPASLRKVLASFVSGGNADALKQLNRCEYEKIVFTGMGSSHYCCFGAGILLSWNGKTSIVKSASQILHYEMNLIDEKTLLFLVSQSGESAEIVSIINELPANTKVVAITNNIHSTLAKRADFLFNLDVENEESVTTRTYVASLLVINLIALSLTGKSNTESIDMFSSAIDNMDHFLKEYNESYKRITEFLGSPSFLCVIGRGFSYSTVFAGGLFINEVGKFPCKSIDSGEFRHGPWEMVDDSFAAIILAPKGKTFDLNKKLALDVAALGGKIILVTDEKIEKIHKNVLIVSYPDSNELTSTLIDIIPVQYTANYIAESKNLEVGKFKWSSKITNKE